MFVKRTIDLLLFGSLFIAACAVSMCLETNLLLHLPLNTLSFYCFVFGATLVQYNLHYLVKIRAVKDSHRMNWSLRNRKLHLLFIAAGTILILFSLFSFHLHHFIILLILGAISSIYSLPLIPFGKKKRIKDFGLIKIITLALLWTIVTVWFPADQLNFDHFSFLLIFSRRFIFMFLLCLLFDMRDLEVDADENIHTLPVMLGIRRCYHLCYILLIAFVLLTIVQYVYSSQFIPFIVMMLSAAITFVVVEHTKKHNSDYIYLAFVDGMMLLQALMVIFSSI